MLRDCDSEVCSDMVGIQTEEKLKMTLTTSALALGVCQERGGRVRIQEARSRVGSDHVERLAKYSSPPASLAARVREKMRVCGVRAPPYIIV